jgi:hypothetical protein
MDVPDVHLRNSLCPKACKALDHEPERFTIEICSSLVHGINMWLSGNERSEK